MLDANRQINKSSPVPLYFQLKEFILSEIKKGTYVDDSPIPTEKDFIETFQISRTTVRQALSELVHEGHLYRIKSKGTYVARPKIQQGYTSHIDSFHADISSSGRVPSTKVLEFSQMAATSEIAHALQLKKGDKVLFLYRVRLADNEPVVSSKTYLPYEHCHFLLGHNFEQEQLYSILSLRSETKIHRIDRIIEAVEASANDEKLLHLKAGKPIQHFISLGFNRQNIPIEYTYSRYRGDLNRFNISLYASD